MPGTRAALSGYPDDRARPLRVLFCVDQFHVGGTEMNAVRTAERLDPERVQLEVLCLRAEGPLLDRYRALGTPVHEFRIASVVSPRSIPTGLRIARFVRERGYDIVHAHDIYSNMFTVPYSRLAGTARVIASRRWWTEVARGSHRALNSLGYRLADRVLANGPSIARLLETQEHVPARKIAVVPNFVDEATFEPANPEWVWAMRRELGLSDDARVLGIVANLHPIKEHHVLLDAAARLMPHWPALRIVLVGHGSQEDALKEQVRHLGLGDRVIFAGLRPNVPSPHHLFEISTLTSRGEGFPNSIVEAMAAGRPVVATRVGGIVDAVDDGRTGLLVPPGDPSSLADAIGELLVDPARGRALGEAGRVRALSRYQASHALAELYGLYESLVPARI